jgi:integrase
VATPSTLNTQLHGPRPIGVGPDYDAAGHRRSPITMPGFHEGGTPRNKGRRYPADPPTVEEIIAAMRAAGDSADGARLRALIVILWRAGLRIGETLDLSETDLDVSRGAVLVRRGKGGRRREVGMDRWAWSLLEPWLATRRQLPVGALLYVIGGRPPVGTGIPSSARRQPGRTAAKRACDDGWRRINSVMPTPSRWRSRACHWSSASRLFVSVPTPA